jgi:hypothetical protein
MDQIILINAGIFFLLFYVLHIIVIRTVPTSKVFQWPFLLLTVSSLLSIALYYIVLVHVWGLRQHYPTAIQHYILCMSLILSNCVSGQYLFTIFGSVLESSIKIKLLKVIVQKGNTGITKKQILQQYSTDSILKKRLQRLIQADTIRYENASYSLIKQSLLIDVFSRIGTIFKSIYRNQNGIIISHRRIHRS